MKKVLWITGIITVLLMSLLLTGMTNADDAVKNALRRGNPQYASDDFEEALKSYTTGLEASPLNKDLNFNAAQTAYMMEDYETAIEYYEKSEDNTDKFLNCGNAYFKLGDAGTDENQKVQYYTQALQTYGDGIIKYPQNVPLKYNYETVKEKLEESLTEQEQQEQQEQENKDQSDGDESSEGEGESSDENSEQEESSEQNQDSEQSENQDRNEKSEDEENSEQKESSEQDEESGEEQNAEQAQEDQESEEGEQQGAESREEDAEAEQDREAIERILNMLESREEESLKNNQEVIGGKEGKNGW